MSKIVQAANSIILSKDKISNVNAAHESGNELFFEFDKKYVWSINSYDDGYSLFYYPRYKSAEKAAAVPPYDWQPHDYISYSSSDIGTFEAEQTFSELYSIIKEKQFGVDTVLDEIIGLNFES
jgi:hypothetical protein